MTTQQTFKDGKCHHYKPIRVKIWNSGFSIKCMKGKKTIVGRPFHQDSLDYDFASFCDNCEEVKLLEEKWSQNEKVQQISKPPKQTQM